MQRTILTFLGMRTHIAGLCEGLIAVRMRADVWLAAGMIVEMRLEVMLLGECLWANGTIEWLDA